VPAQRVGIGASGGKVGGSGGDFLLQKPQTDVLVLGCHIVIS